MIMCLCCEMSCDYVGHVIIHDVVVIHARSARVDCVMVKTYVFMIEERCLHTVYSCRKPAVK